MTKEEEIKAYQKKWREEHKAYMKAYLKEYHKTYVPLTPEQKAQKIEKRRADNSIRMHKAKEKAEKKARELAEYEERKLKAKAKKESFTEVECLNDVCIMTYSKKFDGRLDEDELKIHMDREHLIQNRLRTILGNDIIYTSDSITHQKYTSIDRQLYIKMNGKTEMLFFEWLPEEAIDTIQK